MEPIISRTFRSVDLKQQDLEHKKKAADEKMQKLRELIEQVNIENSSIHVYRR